MSDNIFYAALGIVCTIFLTLATLLGYHLVYSIHEEKYVLNCGLKNAK